MTALYYITYYLFLSSFENLEERSLTQHHVPHTLKSAIPWIDHGPWGIKSVSNPPQKTRILVLIPDINKCPELSIRQFALIRSILPQKKGAVIYFEGYHKELISIQKQNKYKTIQAIAIGAVASGRWKTIEALSWIRQKENIRIKGIEDHSEYIDILEYKNKSFTNKENYDKTISALTCQNGFNSSSPCRKRTLINKIIQDFLANKEEIAIAILGAGHIMNLPKHGIFSSIDQDSAEAFRKKKIYTVMLIPNHFSYWARGCLQSPEKNNSTNFSMPCTAQQPLQGPLLPRYLPPPHPHDKVEKEKQYLDALLSIDESQYQYPVISLKLKDATCPNSSLFLQPSWLPSKNRLQSFQVGYTHTAIVSDHPPESFETGVLAHDQKSSKHQAQTYILENGKKLIIMNAARVCRWWFNPALVCSYIQAPETPIIIKTLNKILKGKISIKKIIIHPYENAMHIKNNVLYIPANTSISTLNTLKGSTEIKNTDICIRSTNKIKKIHKTRCTTQDKSYIMWADN